MINRDIIRRKAVQLTYAYFQNGYHNIENAEKEFLFSLSKAYHLYNTLLLLVVAVTKMARKRYDVAAARADREGQERPSDRFAFNKFATQLEENTMLRTFVEEQRNVWDDKVEFVKNLFLRIEESEMYQEFMASDDDSYDAHRELWRKIYKYFVEDNEDLNALLEEESLYWNDDKDGKNQELLPEYTDVEDREYARRLFRAAIMNSDQYQRYMTEASRNWDFSRLAYMDVVIMQLAIAEMLTFPAIPVSVTLNEYVELAKEYSTGRSAGYINGMLDTIARHLINTNKMHKTMPEKKQVK